MIGVNLSGAEFGNIGDRYGYGYIYPSAANIKLYADRGVDFVRLPVRWERLQPAAGGAIDPAELARLNRCLDDAAAAGVKVIIDVHNFGNYYTNKIGSDAVPVSQFADFWKKLATAIGDKPAVMGYDLMNEPVALGNAGAAYDATIWPKAAQAAVDAIRQIDQQHTVYVEGAGWSNVKNWSFNNALLDVHDPANNLVYEAHMYFDKNNSGTYKYSYETEGASPDMAAQRIADFTSWLAAKGAKGFIGEFSVPDNDPRWLTVLDNALTAMKAAGLDSAYWGAGPWWGNYPMALTNPDGTPSAQLPVLLNHVATEAAADMAAAAAVHVEAPAVTPVETTHVDPVATTLEPVVSAPVQPAAAPADAGQFSLADHAVMTLDVHNNFLFHQYTGNAAEVHATSLSSASAIDFLDGTLSFSQDGVAAEIYRLYDAVLGRAPDPAGFDNWYEAIEHGTSLQTVANGFLQSPEMIQASGQMTDGDFVEFLYQHSLGRVSDPDGKANWVDALAHGASRADLLLGFSESAEHRAATSSGIARGIFISDNSYEQVARLYDTFANRLPDSQGLIDWAESLKSGRNNLSTIADGFAASAEFQAKIAGKSNGEIVDTIYHNTLHRDPDQAGHDAWTNALDHGMSLGSLLLGFSESTEHQMLYGAHVYGGIDII